MRVTGIALVSIVFVTLCAADGASQTFQGGLRGTVKDAQGVIPGAAVTLANQDSGVARETAANDVGQYSFPAVDPGVYIVRVSVPGFKRFERTDVRIGTQQFLTLDIQLEVGAMEETVTVTGEAALIETSNASTGEVLDKTTLDMLPSISRMAYLVSNTVPTVVSSGNPHMNRMQDQTEVARTALGGGASVGNNYLLDGFPITDIQNRPSAMPSIEMLEDVKVQVHTYDGEMGRTGGGVFNATAKSGTSTLHGSGFGLLRPNALIDNNFFLEIQGLPKPEQFWHNYGGSLGGPLLDDKTFFWFAAEGYRDGLTQNGNWHLPTAAERNGDFSKLTDSAGRPLLIYDPLTTDANGNRLAFPGNNINQRYNPATGQWVPANRINPVAANILKQLPPPNVNPDVDDGRPNYLTQSTPNNNGYQISGKIQRNFNTRVSLTGVYMRQYTEEPGVTWFPGPYTGGAQNNRPINVAVLNNTYVMNDSTVLTLRGGYNTFEDQTPVRFPFDPETLGFNQTFLNAIPEGQEKFPTINPTGYLATVGSGGGKSRFYSYGTNGTLTKLAAGHSIKIGGDYRRLGVWSQSFGASSGSFAFSGQFTGSNATSPSALSRNAIADLLLGYPSSGSAAVNSIVDNYIDYYSGYVQDDYRVNSRLTVNYGLRFEHETGLAEKDDKLIVGFNPDVVSPLNVTIPAGLDPLNPAARQVKGGVIYAGVDGASRHQGDPPAVKLSPRAGVVFSVNSDTVLRGGYGVYWAPWNYGATRPVGYSQTTTMTQNNNIPITTIDNPFPNGFLQPTENSLGLLSGMSQSVSYFDPEGGAPRVQQWSADLQRELRGNMSVSAGYMGARGDNQNYGFTVNINQLPTEYLALGSRLTSLVPNPFFSVAGAGTLATQASAQLNSLLVPFPQYGLNPVAVTIPGARSQYHALVLQLRKRVSASSWWGGNFNYTFSRLDDNQMGQYGSGNYFAFSAAPGIVDNYNYLPGSPNYNPDVDYGLSLSDMPHKIVIAPIVQLPFGVGRPYFNTGGFLDYVIGGWSVSAVGLIQSGFPIPVTQSPNTTNLNGAGQRPNIAPGASVQVPGDITDRLTADPRDNLYLDPAAFSLAPAFTLGNAPRILPGVRSPARNSLDLAMNKDFRVGSTARATLRLEVLNLLNTPWYSRLASASVGNANFGQVTTQANYSRFSQITVRFTF
jgi:trimeric autotransporter adhesin